MKKLIYVFLALLTVSVFLCGCGKKSGEESPVVQGHDFTVQEWADYYDNKNQNGGPTSAAEYFLNKGNEEAGRVTGEAESGASTESGDQTGDIEISQDVLDTVAALLSGTPLKEKEGEETSGDKKESDGRTKVVVLDPGHGGQFAGAFANNVKEQTITLQTAKYAKEYLEENYENVKVYLTRDSDVDFADNLKDDLENRVILAKKHGADVLVSLHFNASDAHDQNGANIYISRRSQVSKQCRELAEKIMAELTKLGITNRGILERKSNDMFDEKGDAYDYYAINRHAAARGIPGIIVEHCYMDNETDREFMKSDASLKKLGIADAVGIAQYLGLTGKN